MMGSHACALVQTAATQWMPRNLPAMFDYVPPLPQAPALWPVMVVPAATEETLSVSRQHATAALCLYASKRKAWQCIGQQQWR